jgi:hypothetical protein
MAVVRESPLYNVSGGTRAEARKRVVALRGEAA